MSLMDREEVFEELGTSKEGLSKSEVERRLEEHGPNRLEERGAVSPVKIFLDQFRSVLVFILLASVAVSAALGEAADAIAITVIVILNAALGFMQEYKAEKAIQALKRMVTPKAFVIRVGKKAEIPATELVKGDVIKLESGDRVPADARVVSSSELYVDEAPLTGESTPVHKTHKPLREEGRENSVFMGTNVMRGSCTAVVFATGMETEIGRIAEMVQAVEKEQTPLQERLDVFGKKLGAAALLICAFMFLAGYLRGEPWVRMFLTAVSLAVAAIPEGLPAVVTIALAVGVQRMVQKNVIIRKLSAVETLGSTSVICTDKTGTLTMNKMTVSEVYVDGKRIKVTGVGYEPEGEFKYHDEDVSIDELERLLAVGALCNSASMEKEGGEWKVLGDSTEGALIVSAKKAGLDVEKMKKEREKIEEFPFDSERKRMSVIYEKGGERMAYVKGAPEVILSLSNRIYENGEIREIKESDRKAVLEENRLMAEDALRVLAMAFRPVEGEFESSEKLEKKLVFVGLQGMIDRPRPEAGDALRLCESAGIKVVMVTGDHELTAKAVGKKLGLLENGDVVGGKELEEMSDEELFERVEKISIYARVMPEQKLRIIKAWKKRGKVVAMTGDGVNDAPSIKQADIGVAMGVTGADVTKEASDMVLVDDNFASIVSAVEEGRGIYENIRKFLNFMLGTNVGELLTMLGSIILSFPIPLLPIQILWMNLVTDGLPAVALSVEPISRDVMGKKPRSKDESIVSENMKRSIFLTSIYMSLGSLGAFSMGAENGVGYARSMAFTALVFFQLFRVLSVRDEEKTLFEIGVFSNPELILAVMASIVLQLVVVYWEFFNPIFGTVPLETTHLLMLFGLTFSIFIISEIDKIWKRSVASG